MARPSPTLPHSRQGFLPLLLPILFLIPPSLPQPVIWPPGATLGHIKPGVLPTLSQDRLSLFPPGDTYGHIKPGVLPTLSHDNYSRLPGSLATQPLLPGMQGEKLLLPSTYNKFQVFQETRHTNPNFLPIHSPVLPTPAPFYRQYNYKISRPSITFLDDPVVPAEKCRTEQITEYKKECKTVQVKKCDESKLLTKEPSNQEDCVTDYQIVCDNHANSYQDCSEKEDCNTTYTTTHVKQCGPVWREQCTAGYHSNHIEDCVEEDQVLCTTITATKYVSSCPQNTPVCYQKHPVTKQVEKCEVVPRKSCRSVPHTTCRQVKQTKCSLVPQTTPQTVCHKVPSSSHSCPSPSCARVPVKRCRKTPAQHKMSQVQPCPSLSEIKCEEVPVVRSQLVCS